MNSSLESFYSDNIQNKISVKESGKRQIEILNDILKVMKNNAKGKDA